MLELIVILRIHAFHFTLAFVALACTYNFLHGILSISHTGIKGLAVFIDVDQSAVSKAPISRQHRSQFP